VRLTGAAPGTLDAVLDKLREAGARIETGEDWIRVAPAGGRRRSACAPRRIRAFPPTCRRSSWRWTASPTASAVITETIFENRFMHVLELQRPRRADRHRGQHRDRARRAEAVGRARDGHRPARLGEPGDRRPGGRGRDASSTASTTSIAATTGWKARELAAHRREDRATK
jgi:hypothetical protein